MLLQAKGGCKDADLTACPSLVVSKKGCSTDASTRTGLKTVSRLAGGRTTEHVRISLAIHFVPATAEHLKAIHPCIHHFSIKP